MVEGLAEEGKEKGTFLCSHCNIFAQAAPARPGFGLHGSGWCSWGEPCCRPWSSTVTERLTVNLGNPCSSCSTFASKKKWILEAMEMCPLALTPRKALWKGENRDEVPTQDLRGSSRLPSILLEAFAMGYTTAFLVYLSATRRSSVVK